MLSLLVTQLSLRLGFLDLLSGCSGYKRVLYHLGHHGRVLPVYRLRYRVSVKTPAWFLLKYPRNSSNHWLVFRPIRLLGLHRHPMIHVNVVPVLVSSPLISN